MKQGLVAALGSVLRRSPDSHTQWRRLQERFRGRTLIVHRGFPEEWLEKLLREPGGGGHFRVDLRNHETAGTRAPVDWLVLDHVVPLELPVPLMVRVDEDSVRIRHMTRPANGQVLIPSDVRWLADEMPARYHYRLIFEAGGLRAEPGIPVTDNKIQYDYE